MKITKKIFLEKTREKPKDDDLQRVNCKKAGQVMHWGCGWCAKCDLPKFSCEHFGKRE